MNKKFFSFNLLIGSVYYLFAAPLSDELVILHNVTTVEMNAIASPVKGSLIFNSDDNEIYERNAIAWDKISSDGSETKVLSGEGVTVTGDGTPANPYIFNIDSVIHTPVNDCSSGVQASFCHGINSSVNGTYCVDHDDTGPSTPYLVYCEMGTDSGGWTRVVRTTGKNQQFGQKTHNYNYVAPTVNVGIYEPYNKMKNFSKVMIKKVGTADYASYNLVSTVAGDSIYDLMTFAKNQPVQSQNDTVYDGTRVKGLTSEYSGTKTSGTLNYDYFFMAGINESSDNDQAYMSFSDSTGSFGANNWGDAWRETTQAGTLWSLLNGDYWKQYNFHIGNNYSQAGAGYKGNNNGTYEIYIK